MKPWMRTSAVLLGLSTVMIGGGTMVAHAQTSDSSSSSTSASSGSTDSGSTSSGSTDSGSSTTAPAQGTAPNNANCPGM